MKKILYTKNKTLFLLKKQNLTSKKTESQTNHHLKKKLKIKTIKIHKKLKKEIFQLLKLSNR